jgi:hypothetical protein
MRPGRDTAIGVKGERIVFALAAAAVTAHIVDHLIVGVENSLQFDAVVAFNVITLAAVVAYPRLTPEVQAVDLIVLGLGWLIGDLFVHVVPMVREGAEPTDWTGLGATIGGAAMVGVGIAAARRARAAGPESVRRSDRGTGLGTQS